MKRKSKEITEKLDEAKSKFEELVELQKQAEKEEIDIIEKTTSEISKIADEKNMFCGVVLSKQDIISIVDLALKSGGESVKIPFKLYYNE